MTPRPSLSTKPRPSSAIYVGPGAFLPPSDIPDLPEPPSPVSSNGSGLPSPPATNSTGSGSTESISAHDRDRPRPTSLTSNANMLNGSNMKTFQAAFAQNSQPKSNLKNQAHTSADEYDEDDNDNDNDNDNDEDNTARLDRRHSLKTASENIIALQRVKSLTQRNRMAIDKLSAFSRLSSPSPNPGLRGSRSPGQPSTSSYASTSSSSESSSSRLHSRSASHTTVVASPSPSYPTTSQRSRPPPSHYDTLSGSETERESTSGYSHSHASSSSSVHFSSSSSKSNTHSRSSSPNRSDTPPPTNPNHPPNSNSRSATPTSQRLRRISAPASPGKSLLSRAGASVDALVNSRIGNDGDRPSSRSRTPRKRSSMAMSARGNDFDGDDDDDDDVTHAALAAVASARLSPTGSGSGRKARQPLPREFRDLSQDGSRRTSLDGGRDSIEPTTPYRNNRDRDTYIGRGSPSPKASAATFAAPQSERSPRVTRHSTNRPSTVRELARRHQTRWLSEDLSSNLGDPEETGGRRQWLRGGSAESGLATGRSLVGEGLRAAGLTKRDDDVFGVSNATGGEQEQRRRSRGVDWAASVIDAKERDKDGKRSSSRASGLSINSRVGEGAGPSSEFRTPEARPTSSLATAALDQDRTRGGTRAATSMAHYDHRQSEEDDEPRTAPPALRTQKSVPISDRDSQRTGAGSSLGRYSVQPQSQDRMYSSPMGRRNTASTPLPNSSMSGSQQHQLPSEHTRLMMESLTMFESYLSRLPQAGGASGSIPELTRSAQGIVSAADRLNGLLRAGTNRALEEQIDAEVGDADGDSGVLDLVEVWRKVGGDFRESLRASDELVRGMTGLLLGVGKVIKESMAEAGNGNHMRMGSEEDRRISPDVGGSSNAGRRSVDLSGRRSVELSGRRSTESRRSWELPRERLAARAESISGARPPSALNIVRSSDPDRDFPPQNATVTPASSMRRLFSPREQREHQMNANALAAADSQETLQGYEPSPTPASRQQQKQNTFLDRSRTLPPLSIPSPLPALPSEVLLNRSKTEKIAPARERRKVSIASISTVRASPKFTTISTPNPTTAITPHTVSNSPNNKSFPLPRNDLDNSTRTHGVTFSRPPNISVSALTGLQQQQNRDNRNRTISTSSSIANELDSNLTPPTPATPLSGSETERDSRRRTLGARNVRASLDGNGPSQATRGGEANRAPNTRKERRRTINEIFNT